MCLGRRLEHTHIHTRLQDSSNSLKFQLPITTTEDPLLPFLRSRRPPLRLSLLALAPRSSALLPNYAPRPRILAAPATAILSNHPTPLNVGRRFPFPQCCLLRTLPPALAQEPGLETSPDLVARSAALVQFLCPHACLQAPDGRCRYPVYS